MKIAVNTRLLISKMKLEGIGWFTFETLKRITQKHPEHEFHILFDRKISNDFLFSKNVKPVVLNPQARHPFLYLMWFEISVARYLKKNNIDLFLSPDGLSCLRTNIPVCNIIHDINFVHNRKNQPPLESWYYNYFFPKFAQKASRIGTVSNYSKSDISKSFNIPSDKIDVIYNGANSIFKPISDQEKLETKKAFSENKDYFIFVGALNPRKNIERLLKAFDLFKTKTNADIKLVIVGDKMFKASPIKKAFDQLQHKKDVLFTGRMEPENLIKLYGAAMALTFVPLFEGFGIPIIEAMQCDTPVIASNTTSMPEVAGDAALYINPDSIESIAEGMGKIYESKDLRQSLIEKGRIQRDKFSWDKSAERLWECMMKCLS